ncbi:alpha-L-fucosidase [Pelagicoccus mobilis]|uniref:alpha-L-fucosidase n=1 Tax=Pelagicoccus mobilis TaxID=415221 RepID=A0A934RVR3_9BACT|nr:alpha-L-fucosidase [Pelagicoccus mobilis]MBK1876044.1 alpha-L-fucosidase [Pelagicoccus mobilis]
MKKLVSITLSSLLLSASLYAGDRYEPTWESLDSRETPEWFRDAKFGIFIHWGLYSVPAWAPRGTYSEWYWHAKDGDQTGKHQAAVGRAAAINEFHDRVYGPDFEYSDFRPMFNCEMFEPEEWAKVFKQSHAKYVVLTAKHHDGYCLWPSEEASESFGMAWNSVDSGPKRDLVGDLTQAVRDEDIKMGLYYSIWDWFNPYWPEEDQPTTKQKRPGNDVTRKKYIHEVMYPQFKEIVDDYQPAVIFSDGDWWMDDEKWETKPLLAWLFNNAPNKDEVVINDRWGKVRGEHGGYFTTEYGSGFEDPSILWEENRGIGKSFGYNREETYDDYNSEQLLIFMLVDIVSRGGNFLLDIGPTADGRIPVIMETRLREMGAWLDVNAEAIFETRRWKRDCQWSEGEMKEYTKHDHHHGNPIFEMTINPAPGQAVKQVYFTSKEDSVYAITPGWPEGDELILRDLKVGSASEVTLLGSEKEVSWSADDDDLRISLKDFSINDLPQVGQMYVFKITKVEG